MQMPSDVTLVAFDVLMDFVDLYDYVKRDSKVSINFFQPDNFYSCTETGQAECSTRASTCTVSLRRCFNGGRKIGKYKRFDLIMHDPLKILVESNISFNCPSV